MERAFNPNSIMIITDGSTQIIKLLKAIFWKIVISLQKNTYME